MYRLGLLLLCAGALNAGLSPGYYEASGKFRDRQQNLIQRLPAENRPLDVPEARRVYAFGLLSSSLGYLTYRLASNNDSDSLLDFKHILPIAWQNYNTFAQDGKDLLNEIQTRLTTILRLIDASCQQTHGDIPKCNALVEKEVKKNKDLQNQADLVLRLGQVAAPLDKVLAVFDAQPLNYEIVPYLLNNLEGHDLQELLKQLKLAYLDLLKLRRPQ